MAVSPARGPACHTDDVSVWGLGGEKVGRKLYAPYASPNPSASLAGQWTLKKAVNVRALPSLLSSRLAVTTRQHLQDGGAAKAARTPGLYPRELKTQSDCA